MFCFQLPSTIIQWAHPPVGETLAVTKGAKSEMLNGTITTRDPLPRKRGSDSAWRRMIGSTNFSPIGAVTTGTETGNRDRIHSVLINTQRLYQVVVLLVMLYLLVV